MSATGRHGLGPPKILEIESSAQGDHMIVFDCGDHVELYVDGETVDLNEDRVDKFVKALIAWRGKLPTVPQFPPLNKDKIYIKSYLPISIEVARSMLHTQVGFISPRDASEKIIGEVIDVSADGENSMILAVVNKKDFPRLEMESNRDDVSMGCKISPCLDPDKMHGAGDGHGGSDY